MNFFVGNTINENDHEAVNPATIDVNKRSEKEFKKLKHELLCRRKNIIDLKIDNKSLECIESSLKEKLAEIESGIVQASKIESLIVRKPLPLKYLVVEFCRSVEWNELNNYFKQFGKIKKVTLRETGIEKRWKPHSSAVVEFSKLNCKDFLVRSHSIREEPMIIREFNEEHDQIKETETGWDSDDFLETDSSPPPPPYRNDSNSTSTVDSIFANSHNFYSK